MRLPLTTATPYRANRVAVPPGAAASPPVQRWSRCALRQAPEAPRGREALCRGLPAGSASRSTASESAGSSGPRWSQSPDGAHIRPVQAKRRLPSPARGDLPWPYHPAPPRTIESRPRSAANRVVPAAGCPAQWMTVPSRVMQSRHSDPHSGRPHGPPVVMSASAAAVAKMVARSRAQAGRHRRSKARATASDRQSPNENSDSPTAPCCLKAVTS